MARRTISLAVLGILAVVVAAGVVLFDWNLLRGTIAKRVEHATGRTFAINGNLRVHLSRTPRITVENVVLGNAPWARDPEMARIGRAEFTVDALGLFHRRLILPEIVLSDASLSLEKDAQGRANWDFRSDEDSASAHELPLIHSIRLDHAYVTFLDPETKTDVAAALLSVGADNAMLQVAARGRIKGLQAAVDGTVGGALALAASRNQPYPIDVHALVGSTKARVNGALVDPLRLAGEELNFELQGADMAQLTPILGLPMPPTPEYHLSGHLDHRGDTWVFHKFAGRVGKSDLSGDFTLDRGRQPQFITASLSSRNLEMADLGGFIGADRGAKPSPKPPRAGRVLPQEPFNLDKLRMANAAVKFRGARVITEKLPLEDMSASLKLRDGVLSLEPLNFGVAGGHLVSQIRMDARQPVIKTNADLAVQRLQLEKLLPQVKIAQANAGLLSGRAKLETTGNSLASMLGAATGDAALIMEGGSVSELMVRLSNLDVANSIAVLLTGDRQVPVRCMVTQLKGTGGRFHADPIVLDTGKAVITGNGGVNFADETLDLRLVSRSKSFSLAALRGPILVSGTFKNPSVRPDVGRAVGRGAVATALGVATGGLGLFLPLLDFGGEKDRDCAALIHEAGGDGIASAGR